MSASENVWNDSLALDSEVREIARKWSDRGWNVFEKYTDCDMEPSVRYDGVMRCLAWKAEQDPAMMIDYDCVLDAAQRAVDLETKVLTRLVKDDQKAARKAARRAAQRTPGRGVRAARNPLDVKPQPVPAQRTRRDAITYDDDGVLMLNGVRSDSVTKEQRAAISIAAAVTARHSR